MTLADVVRLKPAGTLPGGSRLAFPALLIEREATAVV
jgi:hypothetical protein